MHVGLQNIGQFKLKSVNCKQTSVKALELKHAI